MKWISLKMHMLPIIFQEIDFVTEKYITILNYLRKEKEESDEKKIEKEKKEFMELREEITKRINELEDFYEENIEDIRVNNIEKARLRLKKLLMYDIETINKIENSTNKINLFVNNEEQTFPPLTEEKKKKIFENSLPNEKIAQIQAAQALVEAEKERIRQNEIKVNNQKKKNNLKKEKNKTSSLDKKIKNNVEKNENYMKPLNKNKKNSKYENNNFFQNDNFQINDNYEKAIE